MDQFSFHIKYPFTYWDFYKEFDETHNSMVIEEVFGYSMILYQIKIFKFKGRIVTK